MYQYAFSFSKIKGNFLIYTLSPCRAVPCSEELVLSDGGFGAAFAVEEDTENGIGPVVLFVDSGRNCNAELLPMRSNHDPGTVYPLNLGMYTCE